MPDAKIVPYDTEGSLYRYNRNNWLQAGVDEWTIAPAQNPDMFLELTNILPPATNVLLRRFGYRFFNPQLDNGATIDSDEHPGAPIAFAIPYFNSAQESTGGPTTSFIFTITPAFATWNAIFGYSAGQLILDTNNNVQRCTTGGVSAITQPVWPTTPVGATTTDGTVTWTLVKYAITIGDMILLVTSLDPAGGVGPFAVLNITDSSFNTWTGITPFLTYANAGARQQSVQVWQTFSTVNLPYASSLTVTVNLDGPASPDMSWATFTGYGNITPPTISSGHALVTAWNSGNLSISNAHTVLFSMSGATANETATNPPWTKITGGSGGDNSQLAFYNPAAIGTYTDSWTSGVPTNAASTLFAIQALII